MPTPDQVGDWVTLWQPLDGGHVGLLVGRTAARTTIPTIIEFLLEKGGRR